MRDLRAGKHAAAAILFALLLIVTGGPSVAQPVDITIRNWPAPPYWMAPAAQESPASHPAWEKSGQQTRETLAELSTPMPFVAITPCRIADTRDGSYPAGFGPPQLSGGAPGRTFVIPSGPCPGIPTTAGAYSLNFTVVAPPGTPAGGYLSVWPAGSAQPVVSTLNFTSNSILANAAVVPAGTGGGINAFVNFSTDLIIDVNGYYASVTGTQAVAANPLQVALLRWYPANQSGAKFSVGSGPVQGTFDGAHIWVTNSSSNSVTRLRASDGASLGTFSVGSSPYGVAFDGANIWVANFLGNNVTKLRAIDGANLGTFSVGTGPIGVAFDGAHIWVANQNSDTVTKLRASDGANLGTFSVGTHPQFVAFDGANIWVTNYDSDNVRKLRASDGANLGTFSVGTHPQFVAFDGANIWVANYSSNNVTKLRASDGANLGTFSVGTGPLGVTFDGANIWVAHYGGNVAKLRASDGANLGTFSAGAHSWGVAFDGANIWVTDIFSNTVTKL